MKTAETTKQTPIDGTLTIALYTVRPIGTTESGNGRTSKIILFRRSYLTLSEAEQTAGQWAAMNAHLRDVQGLTFVWQPDPVEVTPAFWTPRV